MQQTTLDGYLNKKESGRINTLISSLLNLHEDAKKDMFALAKARFLQGAGREQGVTKEE